MSLIRMGLTAPRNTSFLPGSKFDVFLSFRGEDSEDIRTNFIDHLYTVLVHKGIHTFRDDEEIERGEKVSQILLQAIEESGIFIVIFSENYANSKWRLNELVSIMERRERGRKVFVVYYHVDPSEVRKQSGKYGDAFADYENDANLEREQIQKWRDALTAAGNLGGYHIVNQFEQTIIMEITNSIIDILKHQHFGSDYLVGIDNRLEELKSLIGIGFDDVRMLGVCGIGGIGKTTIGKVLYNLISCQFDGVSFLQNVREQSILQLQKELLIDITGEEDKNLNDVDKGINVIKRKLRQKKVLIVLDDVDCSRQLEYLVPNRDWIGEGSRIIITTRDKHLLVKHEVDAIYEVQGLDFEESINLFSLYAFKQRRPEQGYEELFRYIVNYAKGLPLALKVFGSSLHGRTISEWEVVLDEQKHVPMKEIHDVLKISFDGLDGKTKNIFLDISCFFEGEERELVSRILDGADQAITTLYDMSLLTFSNNKIMMHPLVQQMGQEVVRQECPGEPGKQSRLWRSKDVHRILSKNEGTDAIEGIFLNISASEDSELIEFTTEAFQMMGRLRLLKVCQDLKCDSVVKNYEVHVSTGFEFLSNELRYLHWDGYPLRSLPSNFHGENLVELNLQYSKLTKLWQGMSKPLGKLKVINLSHSRQFIEIPNFSNTQNLESLILEGCTSLEKLPSSIWELNSLAHLDLSHCSRLQKLPEIEWNLYSMDHLNLAFCKKLERLPEDLCKLKCLKTLNVIGCSELDRLPKSLESLECLEKLCASDASLMTPQLHSSLTGLCSLKILDVHGTCLSQGVISSDIGSLYSLEELDLSYCNLTEGGIPDDICCLYSLRVLDLSGNHFLRVTNAISQLSKLRVLGLRHCMSLQEIPELPQSLKVLDAHDCISMGISSSLSLWQNQLNCFKSSVLQESQDLRYRRLLSLPANGVSQGFSAVTPGNGEVPKWISHQINLGSEVTAKLPQDWYQNRSLLGFSLCCVYAPQQGEPVDEPKSSKSKDESDEESKIATQPYRLGCELTFLGDKIGTLDYVFSGSSCQCDHDDGVSDSVWVTYYSALSIRKRYLSDEAMLLKASFSGYIDSKLVKVEKCGIGLVYADLKEIHGGAGYGTGVGSGKMYKLSEAPKSLR